MTKIMRFFLMFIILLLALCPVCPAEGGGGQVPDEVTIKHWTCRDVAELAKKYEARKQLPESVVVGGKTCTRGEVAECLLSVMEKVVEKCEREGDKSVPREDLDRISALDEALKSELEQYEGYTARRQAIQNILERPESEQPPFLAKAGVNGFVRGEGVGNFHLPDFSFSPGHAEGRFLYRIKPYAYWHPTDYLDLHVEGQGYGFAGSNQSSNRFSLYQGFIEAKLPGSDLLALKAGRQEYSYGDTFILGPNSFYDGLVFDSARLRVKPFSAFSVDLLGGWYAHPFDNGMNGDLEGVYATYAFGEETTAEAYFFRDTGQPVHIHGRHLYIWGLRGTAELEPVSVELEPVYESGSDDTSAWGGHADIFVEASPFGYHSKLFAGFAYGSGSRDAATGTDASKEFRNPNNDSSLLGDMTVIGDLSGVTVEGHHASGIQDYTLGFGVDISKDLNITATGHYFIANNVQSGLSRDLGLETDFAATYNVNDNLSLIVGYDHFFTKGFFYYASGSRGDIDYGYAMLQFDLSKAIPKKRLASSHN